MILSNPQDGLEILGQGMFSSAAANWHALAPARRAPGA
jgi:hypothetical protein